MEFYGKSNIGLHIRMAKKQAREFLCQARKMISAGDLDKASDCCRSAQQALQRGYREQCASPREN